MRTNCHKDETQRIKHSSEDTTAPYQDQWRSSPLRVRPFRLSDQQNVRALFIRINRHLSRTHIDLPFDAYIKLTLAEEINRLYDYYSARNGGFWIARKKDKLVGMFGLEKINDNDIELRRMYVDPGARRLGIARRMLSFAEQYSYRQGYVRLILSTSEIQQEAIALYKASGYRLERESIAEEISVKTVGSGLRRYHFSKTLLVKYSNDER
ncbi:MAG: GNAT family N-acetyltransferase [Sneathiella sp.]|nr:GNAT family N-acetyltransferase [Sneathiella sp.]